MIELKGRFRGAVVSDEHSPYHDPRAIALANKVLAWWEPEILILNGDQLDFDELSCFEKDAKRTQQTQSEIDIWHTEVLEGQLTACTGAEVIKLDGNHEKRLLKKLAKSEGLDSLRNFCMQTALELDKFGIKHDPYAVRFNDQLLVTHGESALKWSGSSVKAELENFRYGINIIIGHCHRGGTVQIQTMAGHVTGQENPCLCSLRPHYLNTADWVQGLTLFDVTPTACFLQAVTFSRDYQTTVGKQHFSLFN
jgi:predicted phosphodiesterase